jgi:hypothetical protein
MKRSTYALAFVLIALAMPIVALNLPNRQSFGQALNMFIVTFSLGLSGPGLVLYSLIVYHFSQVKEKNFLSAVALLIGLPWTLYVIRTLTFDIS